MKVKRDSSIELLRVISMVFIIFFHMVVYTYHMEGIIEFYSFNNFVFSFFRTGGKFGVALFSIITGYFMIRSKISLKKIILLELQVLFYTISIMFLFIIFDNHSVTKEEFLKIIFPNYMKTYWFFSSYFLLYLCIPILNYILLRLRQEWFLGILGVLFSIFLVVPSVVIYAERLYDGWYLFFYYLVGAYISLFMKNIKGKKRYLFGSIFFYMMIVIANVCLQYLASFNKYLTPNIYAYARISSILIFSSSVCLFLYFKKLKLKVSKWINTLGNVSFGAYLFHEHIYMKDFLWNRVIDANLLANSPYFLVFGICIAIVIFMIGGIYDWVRQIIFKYCGLLIGKINLVFKKYLIKVR